MLSNAQGGRAFFNACNRVSFGVNLKCECGINIVGAFGPSPMVDGS